MSHIKLDPWLEENLVCPRNLSPLKMKGDRLVSSNGSEYPIIDGIPIMLLEEIIPTIALAKASLARAKGISIDHRAPELYMESLGISEKEKADLADSVYVQTTRADLPLSRRS